MAYDKLAVRLAQILIRLNSGEHFSADELADEFNVDIRTIQRDLNQRLSFMPIKKENGKYSLESFALGKFSFKDIQNFAALSGISELYPKLDQYFISSLLNSKIHNTLLIRNEGYQKISYDDFNKVNTAILKYFILYFNYKNKKREVKPYKLVNYKGIWYVLADEKGKLKHFNFAKIFNLSVSEKVFIPNEKLREQILNDKSMWLGESKEVLLKLDKKAKEYFFRKNILSNYELIDEDEEHFILSTQVSYDDEILNIVKQWIPYMRILKPLELKARLENILREYLQ